jgi:hypothetical protein
MNGQQSCVGMGLDYIIRFVSGENGLVSDGSFGLYLSGRWHGLAPSFGVVSGEVLHGT